MSIGHSPRMTAAAERWWNRRSRPAKFVSLLSALAVLMVASAAIGFLAAKRMERAERREASSERLWVTGEGAPAALRHLSSGLLDLKLTAFDLRLLDLEFRSYGGAIQPMDDGILIAELAGGFYRLTFDQPLAPRLQRLATHLELNAAAENEVYLATMKDRYPSNPVRVTDLL